MIEQVPAHLNKNVMLTSVAVACLECDRNRWNYFYCRKLHGKMSYTYDHYLSCILQWKNQIESYPILLSVIFPFSTLPPENLKQSDWTI